MKNFLKRLRTAAGTAYADAGARLTVFLLNEPVRARSLALSALVGASTVFPALANQRVDELIVGIGATALTVGVGESARAKVTPADEK